MMRLLSTFLCIWVGIGLQAQSGSVVAVVEGAKPVIRHKVVAKENWYSVGRNYNLRPADIASANGLGMDKALNIGQALNIPLTADNFAQSGKPASDEAYVPVYHVVQAGEGLYRVGQLYNKVGTDAVKRMNSLSTDAVKPGMRLIVGYLKVKKGQSPLAGQSVNPPVEKQETPALATAKPSVPQTVNVPPAPKAEASKPVASATQAIKPQSDTPASLPAGTGFFAGLFAEQSRTGQLNELNGSASSFKSTSGWNDGKYYILMNGVEPGTVVRVNAGTSGEPVFAKVLGDLPPIKENEGLQARLSNAAFAKLGLSEGTHTFSFLWHK
jgi:LysM repeat protein